MPRSTPAVPPNDALADARPPHPPADAALRNRPIRSYVLRQGRVSAAQERACVNLLPRYGVAFQNGYLAWQAVFGRSGRRVLEIGFGMGETTARIANSHPDTDYLAVEVHTPGVGNLLKLIDLEGLHNLRIVWHDAVAVVEHMIEPDTLDAIHVFFPDPWPKTRHHKRRLIKQAFLEQLARRLKTGGIIHLATDWQPYAEEMLQLLGSEALLRNSTDGFAARPETRPMTKFEQRGRKLGHLVFDLIFARTATGCKAPGGALAATGGALRGDQLT